MSSPASTIGAVAFGLARFDPRVRVVGAILNRVASDKHAATVQDACDRAQVPVLGIIRRDERMSIGSRHLGLIAPEGEAWENASVSAIEAIERGCDLDALIALAKSAPPLGPPVSPSSVEPHVRIAVARDEAFWFYDEGSLDALRDAGAELHPYSPLRDAFPAQAHAAFIGGGYPELHASMLEANKPARESLRAAIAAGMPAYAECGGLMYLGATLETPNARHAMVGALPAHSVMSQRRSALRYVEARAYDDGPFFTAGSMIRGHEFHYSRTHFSVDARSSSRAGRFSSG